VRCTKALQSLAEDKAPPPSRALPKAPDVVVDRHSVNQVGTSWCPTRSAAKMYLGEVDDGGFLAEPQAFHPVLSKCCLEFHLQEMRQAQGKEAPGDKGNCQSSLGWIHSLGWPNLGAQRLQSVTAILCGTYLCCWPPIPARRTLCEDMLV
jgi:hypothetical protein